MRWWVGGGRRLWGGGLRGVSQLGGILELAGGRSAPERLFASRIDIVIVAGIGRGNEFGGEMRAVMFFGLMKRRLVVDTWGSGLGCCRDASSESATADIKFL